MERISGKSTSKEEKKEEPGYISSSSGFSSLPPSAGSLSSPSLTPPSSNSSLQDSDSSEGADNGKVSTVIRHLRISLEETCSLSLASFNLLCGFF